ncbi:DUF1499 domain-containing protein [Asticcacaulis sp. AC402]|uniref:DUF1499 domain-containing protein n=1 Tax=Asticcacaulis sp. AC402 TaxID=1282361 RepID=UPI0003C3CBB6|nr:DUF1499 domain-containing protein [Asticcacaulis sp. AC402]ESQ74447.1 hypothetical protein ABAC402_14105 [Asticcacaulis sp. AC402]
MTEDLPTSGHKQTNKKKGLSFAHFAFMVSLVTPLFLLGVMMASNLGYISHDLGFKTLTLNLAPKMAMGAMVVSGLSLLISLFMAPGRCGPWALAAVVLTGSLLGGFWWYQKALKANPPIGDVATNWERPVSLSGKLIEARGADARPVEDVPRVPRNESMDWGGKTIPEINALACPRARTITKKEGVTSQKVVAMLKANDYVVFGSADWRVEATYQDPFYGFKSDVVIRLDPNGIDIRSVGRYPMPDLGSNCRRVIDLIHKIEAL